MSARFEAVALKKLQELLRAKGISTEALFAKYDLDGNGSLDIHEFKQAIASISGQNAPEPIIRAVFAALDTDGDASLDIPEILALVEGGQAPSVTGEMSGVEITGHTNSNFNGVYDRQEGLINNYQWFSKSSGHTLYHYDGGAGGARSWSLHSSRVDGSEDRYDGGWTRPPSSGDLPLGTRRWVGVGMLTLSAIGERTTPSAGEAESESTTEIRIEVEKSRFNSNESIKVDFTGPQLYDDAWLGIVPAGIDHGDAGVNGENRVQFISIDGQTIGSHTFDNPGVGDWTIRLNDSSATNKELAYVEFSVEAAPVSTIAESSYGIESVSDSFEEDEAESLDAMLSQMGPEFGAELEALVATPDQSLATARAKADLMAAEKINELPFLFRAPARRMWDSNADSILVRIAENLPPPEELAQAAVVAGAMGAGAVAVAAHTGREAKSPQEAVVDAVVDMVVEYAAGDVLGAVSPIAEAPAPVAEPEPVPEPEVEPAPAPEPPVEALEPEQPAEAPAPESPSEVAISDGGLDLVDVIGRLNKARFLNDQIAVIESTEGLSTTASVHIDRLERTFSIGIDDAYRGGQTIIGSIEGIGEVEIHLKADVDTSGLNTNDSESFTVSVHKWNGIRKRLELNAL